MIDVRNGDLIHECVITALHLCYLCMQFESCWYPNEYQRTVARLFP